MGRNKKTTAGGITMIVMGLAGIVLQLLNMGGTSIEVSIGMISGGIALIAARDAGTGSDAPPA